HITALWADNARQSRIIRASGSPDEMIQKMSGHMAAAVREKFQRVMEAAEHKDDSVEAGRDYVEAYVIFAHYVEAIHSTLMSGAGHQHENAAETPAHQH
ncbi:MAG TPA: DUF6448 family protein, partial [Verrucomicrobiota bacterium]|nr:DUF6448 family protein [Verrucomicrobiota bacterium]